MKQFSNQFIESFKTAALIATLALGISNVAPQAVRAQKNAARAAMPSKVEIAGSSAVSDGKTGVLLEWQSSYEVNTLGYNSTLR